MEQDCKWALHRWPCALPDKKNGAMAKAYVPIPSIRDRWLKESEPTPPIMSLCHWKGTVARSPELFLR